MERVMNILFTLALTLVAVIAGLALHRLLKTLVPDYVLLCGMGMFIVAELLWRVLRDHDT